MTPEQKMKALVIAKFWEWEQPTVPVTLTADNVDDLYDEIEGEDYTLQDARSEVRCGVHETGLPAPHSRHYESKSVAAQTLDGSWVGWTYWYGGGKHGVPEAIDWMDEAYDLKVTEEEKMVVVRTFELIEETTPA